MAACGGKDSGGSKNPNVPDNGTITVMLLEKGLGKDFLNDVRDDFYNETGITVEVYGDPNIDENIKNMMLTGDAPDDIYLTGLTYDWINWVNSGNIEDLSDLCNEKYDDGKTINDKIASEIRNLGKIGDHRFIIQLSYCPTGIVYNQDMLNDLYEKKLVDSNVFPTEWNALVKLANDVSNANYKYKNNSKKLSRHLGIKPQTVNRITAEINDKSNLFKVIEVKILQSLPLSSRLNATSSVAESKNPKSTKSWK